MHEDLRLASQSTSLAERWAARLHSPSRRQAAHSAFVWLPVAYFVVSAVRSALSEDWGGATLRLGLAAIGAFLQWERSGVRQLIERYETRVGYLTKHSRGSAQS
jgi:hypothetical protein